MVDMPTRKKLEEMLKTWKEPVPGSIDTRPVFPPDIVRPIENALIKVRTTALQHDQERMRNQQQLYGRARPTQGGPHRETAAPSAGARPPSQLHAYPTHQPHPMQHSNGIPYTQPPPVSYPSQAVSFPL